MTKDLFKHAFIPVDKIDSTTPSIYRDRYAYVRIFRFSYISEDISPMIKYSYRGIRIFEGTSRCTRCIDVHISQHISIHLLKNNQAFREMHTYYIVYPI